MLLAPSHVRQRRKPQQPPPPVGLHRRLKVTPSRLGCRSGCRGSHRPDTSSCFPGKPALTAGEGRPSEPGSHPPELTHFVGSFWGLFISGCLSLGGLRRRGCMHVFRTVRAEKAPKIRRERLPHQQGGAGGSGAAGEHGGGGGRQQDGG